MKHRASVLAILACAFCLALGLAGCSGQSEEYTPALKDATVSSPAIGEDGTLRVGVAGGESAPFTLTSNDEVVGLDVDMAAAIADQMGLKLQIVNVESDGETALANGEVDILMSQVSDGTSSLWLSEPYIPTAIALFAGADASEVPSRESAPLIAAQGSSTSAWAVSTAYGDSSLVSSGDLMSAFSSVEEGQAQYVAADAVIGTYAALYQNVDMKPIALFEQPGGYCIGVSPENVDLQQAITDALSAVTSGGISNVISAKWLGTTLDLASLPVIESASTQPSDSDAPQDEGSEGNDAEADANADADADADADASADEQDGAAGEGDGSDAGSNAVVPGQAA
jgi:polar amino acid transport system substrate-binding protein